MTTLTIELADDEAQQWRQEAERLSMTVEQLVTQSVKDRLAGRKRSVTQATQRIIEENEELYRRLA